MINRNTLSSDGQERKPFFGPETRTTDGLSRGLPKTQPCTHNHSFLFQIGFGGNEGYILKSSLNRKEDTTSVTVLSI